MGLPREESGNDAWERMLGGRWYHPVSPELVAARGRAAEALARVEASGAAGREQERDAALRELLGSFGEGAQISAGLRVDYGCNIHVGRDVFVNYELVALDCAEIRIGDGVLIGPRCQLLTPIHPMDDIASRRAGFERALPIVLEENVWLGGGVVVNPGVRIGAGSVVGSGSVVTRDVPAGVFAAGVPARVVRPLSAEELDPAELPGERLRESK